jgi:hypothetical protein
MAFTLFTRYVRQVRASQETSTYDRLQRSRHVADLRLILYLTAVIASLVILSAYLFAVEREVTNNWTEVRGNDGWVWLRVAFSSIVNFPFYAGAILSGVAALAASVFAWVYQTGRTRLGVVDLIAAEIIAICNTLFALNRLQRYITLASSPDQIAQIPAPDSSSFILDSLLKDVEQLENDVVYSVVEFYTYAKATRDAARRLSELQEKASVELIVDVIKLHYLALAQARRAVEALVEFEPARSLAVGLALNGEIVAHGFLRDHIDNSFRRVVWNPRDEEYGRVIPFLCRMTEAMIGPKWEQPKAITRELFERYSEIFRALT